MCVRDGWREKTKGRHRHARRKGGEVLEGGGGQTGRPTVSQTLRIRTG